MEKVRIVTCVSEAIHAVQLSPDVHIKMENLDDLPMVTAGGQSLTLVFKNLIENANTAMNGKGNIKLQGLAGSRWVEVSIIDDGPGVSPELHNQIFELNFTGRSGGHPGKLGFGLWWVKTLMNRLGGSVTVESDGEHGATFIMRLPRAENSS
jgi:signal transduction histidine kinase